MKNILVIGSEGFIGSNVIKWFKKKYSVFGVDLKETEGTDYVFYRIADYKKDFSELFHNHQFDYCINCSGSTSVKDSFEDPYRDYISNIDVVTTVLEAIRSNNCKCRFINISSAAVYGNPVNLPVKENDLLKPISPYGFNKMIAEEILQEYSAIFGIPTVSLRIFSTYGPGQKKLLLWDLYQKMKKSDKILLFGTGTESRDYIFIDDVCLMIDKIIDNAGFNGEAINCASGVESTIKDVAELFASIFMFKGEITFKNERILGYPDNWKADVSLAESLGFHPQYSLRTGVERFCKWLEELD